MTALGKVQAWLHEHGHKLHVEVFADRGAPNQHHICTWWGVAGRVVILQVYPREGFEVYFASKAVQVDGIIKELEVLCEQGTA